MHLMKWLLPVCIGAGAAAAFVFRGQPATDHQPAKDKDAPTMNQTVYSSAGFDVTPLPQARIDELAKSLSKDEADVILAKGTERAFCGNLVDNKKDGLYACRLCGLPLFASDAKFNSGTGWPSFFRPYAKGHVKEVEDRSYGMVRTEILCQRCGGHLGHVFDDGPAPTGLRFCLNSVSLKFYEKGEKLPPETQPPQLSVAYVAGGCFWGVEDLFQQTPGVVEAVSGYMGGKPDKPTYKMVCYEDTGHAETVKVVFDPKRITYKQVLEKFFKFHDPTQVNRQGPDVGDQYRSAIFPADDAQLAEARAFIAEQATAPRFKGRTIATQVIAASATNGFHEAEEYHQDYHARHGGHCALPTE